MKTPAPLGHKRPTLAMHAAEWGGGRPGATTKPNLEAPAVPTPLSSSLILPVGIAEPARLVKKVDVGKVNGPVGQSPTSTCSPQSKDGSSAPSCNSPDTSPVNGLGGKVAPRRSNEILIKSDLHKEFAEAKLPKKFFKHMSKLQSRAPDPRRQELELPIGKTESMGGDLAMGSTLSGQPQDMRKRASTVMENIWDTSSEEEDSDEESAAFFNNVKAVRASTSTQGD